MRFNTTREIRSQSMGRQMRFTACGQRGAKKVKAVPSLSGNVSIIERVERIYARMQIEACSGVAPAHKEIFLSLCQQYEQTSAVIQQELRHKRRVNNDDDTNSVEKDAPWNNWDDWDDVL